MKAATAAIMTGIITLALVSRARHRFLLFSLDSIGVLLLYVTAVFLLYFLQ
jgi:hypothetical protein